MQQWKYFVQYEADGSVFVVLSWLFYVVSMSSVLLSWFFVVVCFCGYFVYFLVFLCVFVVILFLFITALVFCGLLMLLKLVFCPLYIFWVLDCGFIMLAFSFFLDFSAVLIVEVVTLVTLLLFLWWLLVYDIIFFNFTVISLHSLSQFSFPSVLSIFVSFPSLAPCMYFWTCIQYLGCWVFFFGHKNVFIFMSAASLSCIRVFFTSPLLTLCACHEMIDFHEGGNKNCIVLSTYVLQMKDNHSCIR